ncbi:DnaT-like ssDNA-binding protein [Methylobacterium fujisawaense]|uniref:DnaT-like ssDNA-binding protein n=1 Tax=Methylobacterium fujisawaense TaxID=107400 RepID=UPI003CE9CD31
MVVEDGRGRPDAESYASVEAADAYHAARGNTAWAGDQAVKEAALRRGTEYLDDLYRTRWLGRPAVPGQGLCWPRACAWTSDGFLPADAIPTALVRACCEAALREIQNPGGLTPDIFPGERVVSEAVGPLKVDYAAVRAPTDVLPVIVTVERIVAPLLGTAVGPLVMRA